MHEWTDAAREELDRYLKRAEADAASSGADPAEVADDLRRHVDQELAAAAVQIVTQEDVRRVLVRIGGPDRLADGQGPRERVAAPAAPRGDPAPEPAAPGTGKIPLTLFVVFGVVLPLIALVLEMMSGMCAGVFFDPIPTIWHVALIALVPLANALACVALSRGQCRRPGVMGWLIALAAGVALYYAVIFAPLSPFACIGILYFGLGLIPLSPLIALIVALSLRRRLRKMCEASGLRLTPRLWQGVLAIIALLLVLELPKTVVLAGVRMAASEDQATRARGLRLLRSSGSEEALLRACYSVSRPITDMISFVSGMMFTPVPIADVQRIYYKVTGTPYNAVPPPDLHGIRWGSLSNGDEFDFAQGGDEVAARVRGLSLQQSRLDSVVDAASGTVYTEWTLVFKNTSSRQREARSRVALPPGGAVSRLTLWIGGEEREAAFGGRSKVKAAYQQVVQQRRDPVLVTTAGRDQVLLQCFPVPPNGGEMKVRVGITAPLCLESFDTGLFRLPYFVEQNFGVRSEVAHSVWVEGNGPLCPARPVEGVLSERPSETTYAVRGNLNDSQLERGFAIRVQRPADIRETWSEDERGKDGEGVRQLIAEKATPAPRRVAIVVDGSRRMGGYAEQVAQALTKCPEGVEFAVFVGSDEVVEFAAVQPCTPDARARVAEKLKRFRFAGGCDNVPALLRAWDWAAGSPDSAIVWFHATQPVPMMDSEALRQKWERRPGNPVLCDFQFGTGPNTIAESLNGLPAVRQQPNLGDPERDACGIFELWSGSRRSFAYQRRREPAGGGASAVATGSTHIVRLWAFDEIVRLAGSRAEADRDKAAEMAMTYQLVTPVSGAVVLETKEQYLQAGLSPVASDTVPNIVPEGQTWVLLAIGLAVMLVFRNRRWLHAKARCR